MEEIKPLYHVAPALKHLWAKKSLERMKKENSDDVTIVDGPERVGKSQFTIQQACYIEPGLLESPEKLCSRICFSAEEFRNVVRNVQNGVVIFDEAFRGLASRSAMSKTNKALVQTLMEMGQNNNIVFVVLPSFFMLDIYPAMLRSNRLFNIYKDRNKRRCFRGYNRTDKNKIYQIGIRKGWTYPFSTGFKGNFFNKFPGGEEFEKAYLKKKYDALHKMFDNEKVKDDVVEIAKKLRKENGMNWAEIGKIVGLSAEAIRKRVSRTDNQSI